jgi:transposase-like protein
MASAQPRTLLEAVKYFSDKDIALQFVAAIKWPNGVACPSCGSKKVGFLSTRRLWKCRDCAKQFSAKVGTIFEDSPIGLEKWMPAMWMIVNCKNGISSYELARALGVTQKTAWFMLHRIRAAMQSKSFRKLQGNIEVDESYIGGKSRNMHVGKRKRIGMKEGRAMAGKVAVMGLLERHGSDDSLIRLEVVDRLHKRNLHRNIRKHVEMGSTLHTDAFKSYEGLTEEYVHNVIDHAEAYVDGQVHTNGMENFWSLLKRMLRGTYVSVEPFHLFRYLDEQAYRFNNRKDSDLGRFVNAVKGILDKRVTYVQLTGQELPQTC